MINKYYEILKRCLVEKKYLEFSLYCLLILGLSALVIIATAYFLNFIAYNFETISFIVGGYILLYYIWKEWRKGRKEENELQKEKQNAILNQLKAQESESEKTLLESNYIAVRQCIYSVLMEIADKVNLAKPQTLSEMDSPSRVIFKGNVPMCQFLVLKTQEISTSAIKEIMQIRIAQRLTSTEFAGITQTTYIYDGQAFPILCIDDVLDVGSYIQVDVAWANEAYCNLVRNRKLANFENQRPMNQNIKDKDF